jgi:methionyl aminopeptidase
MIKYKTPEEVELLRKSSLLVSKTLATVAAAIKPGITTLSLDQLAETCIRDNGGKPAFKGYKGFPFTLCVSVNAHVVHGFPSQYEIRDGDIVSVDCGVLMNNYYGDSAFTFPVGLVQPEVMQLLSVTKQSLYKGIEKVVSGGRLGDVSEAIQNHAESFGFGVVRELVGHGIGKNLHEAPEVPNFGRKGSGPKLSDGLVIAIEPMINLGRRNVKQERDGWTISTIDGQPSAHFEHTVAVNGDKADILSSFAEIENELLKQGIEF